MMRLPKPYLAVASSWMLLIPLAAVAAEEQPASPQAASEMIQGSPIDSGFVLIDGQYLAPPYVVQQRDDELFVNDHPIPHEALAPAFGRGRGGPGGGPFADRRGGFRSSPISPTTWQSDRIERQLHDNGMLLVVGDDYAEFLSSTDAAMVLETLVSNSSADKKAIALVDLMASDRLTSADWKQIADRFAPTPELERRAQLLLAEYREVWQANAAGNERLRWYGFLASRPVAYGVTLVAMLLAVAAMGNLLITRPEGQGRWKEINADARDRNNVVRNVILLGLLSGFDLMLTLLAQQAGTLLELNPLGSQLVASPILLAAFKLTSLAAACLILLSLRNYRGAQIASWWMCLLCTVVTFRWVTFNSLFVG